MKVPIYVNKQLQAALQYNDIQVEDYRPAYEGESAALDLYLASSKEMRIRFNTYDTLVPTGLHIVLPKGSVGLLRERGSITRSPLLLRAGVIDPSYTGEIFINAVNLSTAPYIFREYSKLPFQLLVIPVCNNFIPTVEKEVYDMITKDTKRKEGKIGSSDI